MSKRTSRGSVVSRKRLALAFVLSLLTASCSSGTVTSGGGEGGGALTLNVVNRAWTTLDPASSKVSSITSVLAMPIYGTLFWPDEQGEPAPELATGYSFANDGRQMTITLREGVVFQDDTPFDAEAVAFNIRRNLDPVNKSNAANYLTAVESVESTDAKTVVLNLKRPDSSLPFTFAMTSAGWIGSPKAIKEMGEKFGSAPVGAGPFQFVSQVPGVSLSLKRFEKYWRTGQASVDTVKIVNVADPQTAYNAVRSGTAQIMAGAEPLQVNQAKSESAVKIIEAARTGFHYTGFNMTSGPFNNVAARRAIALATDQGELSKGLYFGVSEPMQSPFGPGSFAHPGKTVAGYPDFDLEAAKKAVRDLGGLKFELLFTPLDRALAQALQTQWQRAGIDVSITQLDVPTFYSRYQQNQFQALAFYYPAYGDPDQMLSSLYKSGALFAGGFVSQRGDELLRESLSVVKFDERAAIYKLFAEEMAKELPLVFASSYVISWLTNEKVKGLRVFGGGMLVDGVTIR